jgi:glycosyltransferase involved in cell wall biosynthesis
LKAMHQNEHESESFVSVIIPAHNSSRTLSKCIDSIVEQTYPNWEIIVINSDNTQRLVEAYHRKLGDKCQYYVIRNRFQAAKRN